MENLNLAKLEEMNIIKENVALAASKELLGANDLPAKVKVIIDGKVLEIIPAFTDYNMEQPKKKEKLLEQSDAGKRLDVIFTLPPRRPFGKRGTRSLTEMGIRYTKIPPMCFLYVTQQTAIGGYSRTQF